MKEKKDVCALILGLTGDSRRLAEELIDLLANQQQKEDQDENQAGKEDQLKEGEIPAGDEDA